jgi:hypothetical protein
MPGHEFGKRGFLVLANESPQQLRIGPGRRRQPAQKGQHTMAIDKVHEPALRIEEDVYPYL